MNYTIRKIKPNEVDQAFQLLTELIKEENLQERFRFTPEKLYNELFRENTDWYCLVAINSNKIVSICFYSIANINRAVNPTPLIQIDDIYTIPAHREEGIGQKFIEELSVIARNKNINRIEVWCLKNNILGQNFYKKMGGIKLDTIDVFRIPIT
jgi:ribosomal protein S18 acetylase RimI-like enzyme